MGMGIVIERVRFLVGISGKSVMRMEITMELVKLLVGILEEGDGDNLGFGDCDGDNDGVGETFGGDFRGV
uniref:Uncharacterized protein n=1 Tax=Salix viminalis TaxID=40686 RepID=A0A6N2MKG2_SALVM